MNVEEKTLASSNQKIATIEQKKKEMKQNFFFFITAGVQPSSASN